MSQCIICNGGGEKLIVVTDRGKESLKKFAKLRNNENILKALDQVEQCLVHESCRKKFNNQKQIESEQKRSKQVPDAKMETRSESKPFSWISDCFLCGEEATDTRQDWHFAKSLAIKHTILKSCDSRLAVNSGDSWALNMRARLEQC